MFGKQCFRNNTAPTNPSFSWQKCFAKRILLAGFKANRKLVKPDLKKKKKKSYPKLVSADCTPKWMSSKLKEKPSKATHIFPLTEVSF